MIIVINKGLGTCFSEKIGQIASILAEISENVFVEVLKIAENRRKCKQKVKKELLSKRMVNRSNLNRFSKFLVLNYLEFGQLSNACSINQIHGSGQIINGEHVQKHICFCLLHLSILMVFTQALTLKDIIPLY